MLRATLLICLTFQITISGHSVAVYLFIYLFLSLSFLCELRNSETSPTVRCKCFKINNICACFRDMGLPTILPEQKNWTTHNPPRTVKLNYPQFSKNGETELPTILPEQRNWTTHNPPLTEKMNYPQSSSKRETELPTILLEQRNWTTHNPPRTKKLNYIYPQSTTNRETELCTINTTINFPQKHNFLKPRKSNPTKICKFILRSLILTTDYPV